MSLSAGTKLGPYEVTAPLGAGGMAEVYRARDTRLGRDVALKMLPERGDLSRFHAEARALAALNHPGIVAIYDTGDNYLVTELIDGAPLRASNERQAADLAAQVAEALAAAHSIGITHRDLKPGNILLTKDGRTKIIDFGLVRNEERAADASTLTAEGTVMGTAAYMSPEQVRGAKVDARTDLFSLGVVLYEMLAGKRPFEGSTAAQVMTAVLEREPAELPETVSAPLRLITLRLLAKDREHRFQSARDLAFALRSMTGGVSVTVAAAAARRNWIPVAAALAGLLAGAAAMSTLVRDGPVESRVRITPVSREPGSEATPVLSPDGKSVVYEHTVGSRGRLMLRTLSSGATVELAVTRRLGQVTPNRSIFWASDGMHVYFQADDVVWRVGVAGGPPEKVLAGVRLSAMTPDGKALVIRRGNDLLRSELPGAEAKPFARLASEFGLGLFVSPDGSSVAVPSSAGLAVARYPDGSVRYFEGLAARTPQWFRDNRHVMVASSARRELLWLDTATGAKRSVHVSTEGLNGATMDSAGAQIIYAGGPVGQDIFEHTLDGRRSRALAATQVGESTPAWTPNGRQMVFNSGRGDLTALVIRDMATGAEKEIHQVASTGRLLLPRVSPDGRRVAFSYKSAVWTIPLQGGVPQQIAATYVSRPTWSPDGTWIVGLSEGQVIRIPSQGGKPESITRLKDDLFGEVAWLTSGLYFRDGSRLRRWREGALTDIGEFTGEIMGASADGQVLYELLADEGGNRLALRDARTGAVIRTVPIETTGLVRSVAVHPDGKRMAVWVQDAGFDLWKIEGFPVPEVGWRRLFRSWVYPGQDSPGPI